MKNREMRDSMLVVSIITTIVLILNAPTAASVSNEVSDINSQWNPPADYSAKTFAPGQDNILDKENSAVDFAPGQLAKSDPKADPNGFAPGIEKRLK